MPTNTKTLGMEALKVIGDYAGLMVGNAIAPVPYFNNKTVRAKMTVRALVGKGSPKDISDEIKSFIIKHHISLETLSNELLKKIMVDNNIGVDCSAFAYHILEAENHHRGYGALNRHISFVNSRNPISKLMSYLRPVENCDVGTIASESNSRAISLNIIAPGDFISMIDEDPKNASNHILVIHAVEYDGQQPKKILYSHSIRYATDGLYESGFRGGEINIRNIEDNIINQEWVENSKTDQNNPLWIRAKNSRTELRRLKWL